MGFVTTSNFHPDGLYPDGLHRDRILPAIELLKEQLEVVNVDAGTDYRQRAMEQVEFYLTPLSEDTDRAMEAAFERLAEARDESPVLHIEQREIRAMRRAGGVVWFDFRSLCGGPRSQNDYLELARGFHTVLLSGVPRMTAATAPRRRGASPGWSTFSTTTRSSCSSPPRARRTAFLPKARRPATSRSASSPARRSTLGPAAA